MFRLRRFYAIFQARNREFFRDKGTLGWTFVFPILVIVAFGYMFRFSEETLYKGGLIGGDAPKVEFVQWIDYPELEDAMERLRVHKVDFILDQSRSPPTYYTSETSPKSRMAEKLLLEHFRGGVESVSNDKIIKAEAIQGDEIEYVEWLFPGLIAMNITWMALFGVGWVIVRQRKNGILKRFQASPLTAFEYLLAQVVSRMLVLVLSGILVFAVANFVYPFETRGSYFHLFLIYAAGCFALSSVGLIIAARMANDELASGLINMVNMPMIFLSEVWFSLEGSPDWVRGIAKAFPLWHTTDAMRKVMLEGYSLAQVQFSFYALVIIGFTFTLLGAFFFRWGEEG